MNRFKSWVVKVLPKIIYFINNTKFNLMKYITQTINNDLCKIDLKVVVPEAYYLEHFIDGLNGRRWGFLSNPTMFADIYNKAGEFQFTLTQKEFDHIKIDITNDLNILKFKTEYYIKYEFDLNEDSKSWNEYALMVQKNHIAHIPTLFSVKNTKEMAS